MVRSAQLIEADVDLVDHVPVRLLVEERRTVQILDEYRASVADAALRLLLDFDVEATRKHQAGTGEGLHFRRRNRGPVLGIAQRRHVGRAEVPRHGQVRIVDLDGRLGTGCAVRRDGDAQRTTGIRHSDIEVAFTHVVDDLARGEVAVSVRDDAIFDAPQLVTLFFLSDLQGDQELIDANPADEEELIQSCKRSTGPDAVVDDDDTLRASQRAVPRHFGQLNVDHGTPRARPLAEVGPGRAVLAEAGQAVRGEHHVCALHVHRIERDDRWTVSAVLFDERGQPLLHLGPADELHVDAQRPEDPLELCDQAAHQVTEEVPIRGSESVGLGPSADEQVQVSGDEVSRTPRLHALPPCPDLRNQSLVPVSPLCLS